MRCARCDRAPRLDASAAAASSRHSLDHCGRGAFIRCSRPDRAALQRSAAGPSLVPRGSRRADVPLDRLPWLNAPGRGPPDPSAWPRSHLVLRVSENGASWHADVGFARGILEPISFGPGSTQEQSGWSFRVVEDGSFLPTHRVATPTVCAQTSLVGAEIDWALKNGSISAAYSLRNGANRSSIEPRSTGVVGSPGREASGSAGQRSATAGCCEPAASNATAGLGGRCSGPGPGWPGGADANSGDPCSGRNDARGGGGVEFRQGGFGFQRLGLLTAIRAGGKGAVCAGESLNLPLAAWCPKPSGASWPTRASRCGHATSMPRSKSCLGRGVAAVAESG